MKRTLFLLPLLLAAAPLAAQAPIAGAPGEELVDQVVAVVGDTALLRSDVLARVQQQLAATGQPMPTDPVQQESMFRTTMNQLVDDLVIVEAARRLDITVPDADVKQQADEQMQAVLRNFGGSEARFDQALAASGMTRPTYRRILEQGIRDQELEREYMQRQLATRARPVISEDQLRAAFDEQKERLGTRPATVSLQQVIVSPEPSDSARARAIRTAEDVLKQLATGADFEVLAKRYSDDPGTKEQGGDLGWFKQGRMVKEFEDVVFRMRPGQTSGIVKSPFGYHIIKLEKVRGPERQARHILIKPAIDSLDVQRARQRADSVAGAVRGGANVTALAKAYGTQPAEAEVARIPIDRLPPSYTAALQDAQPGAVVGPIDVEGPTGTSFAVVKVTDRQAAGPYTLDDIRDQLLQRVQEQQMMEQLVTDLRRQMFVKVLI
jgi:peptidyl-prolyl cis-trans isomerase SurA